MATRIPKLSIGLPVYNGEQYLRQAIDSILNQTFTDFELIISDNASVDSTAQIIQEYVQRDARVRYYRQEVNVGAAENFNFVFRQARGEYFKWAAHDDVLDPTFLEKCIDILDQDPSFILSYTKVNRITPQGDWAGSYDYSMRVSDPKPHHRFADLILVNHFCVAVFGVIRRSELGKTPLIAKFVGSDRTLLAELALRGRFCELPEYLFYRRDHPSASTRLYRHHARLGWFDPKQKGHLHMPYWRNGLEHVKATLKVPLPFFERLKCTAVAFWWYWRRRKVLIEDVKAVVVQLMPFALSIKKEAKGFLKKSS